MDEAIITVQGQDLQVKEYQNRRVVTFRDIDELHQRPEGTAKRNFAENREKFIDGTDYFRLTFAEINSTNFVQLSSPNGLTILTESGYLMLVKSFTDDLAWIVQRELVSNYFRVQAAIQPLSTAQTIQAGYEALMTLVEEMKPKAEYFDALVDRNLLSNFRDTAKEFQVKESFFMDWLFDNGYIYRDQKEQIRPIASHTPELFELKEYKNPKNGHVGQQTLITPKGRETFRLLLADSLTIRPPN